MKRWSGLPLKATGYEIASLFRDDHPPDIKGFSQIRYDDTEFNQFPRVPGEDTESITQFWENPSVSPAGELSATGSHPPLSLGQALDNVPSIVADIVHAALDSIQSPEQHEGVAAACAELARLVTNILREKLTALDPSFVNETCESHADTMINAYWCDARRQRLQRIQKARAEKQAQRQALAQAAHDRMAALRHAQVCESIAVESAAEEFDSPEIEIVKNQLPILDAGYNLFDPTSIDMFHKELDYLWEVSFKSERQPRCQKCPVPMKLGFLVSSLSWPVLRLLGRCLLFPCEKIIRRWFHTSKEQLARQLTHFDQIDQQIQLFMKVTNLVPNSVVSLAVDAIATNSHCLHLPSKGSEHAIVVFLQPVDRQY